MQSLVLYYSKTESYKKDVFILNLFVINIDLLMFVKIGRIELTINL